MTAELQALSCSSSSHKDSVEKYRQILQQILDSAEDKVVRGLQVFIKTGELLREQSRPSLRLLLSLFRNVFYHFYKQAFM